MIYYPGAQYMNFFRELDRMFCDLVISAAPEEYDLAAHIEDGIMPESQYPPEVDEAIDALWNYNTYQADRYLRGDIYNWNYFIEDGIMPESQHSPEADETMDAPCTDNMDQANRYLRGEIYNWTCFTD
jgi:hypothetical protein